MAINCPAYYSHLQRKLARSCPLLYGTLLSCLPHAMEGAMGYCSLPTQSLMLSVVNKKIGNRLFPPFENPACLLGPEK